MKKTIKIMIILACLFGISFPLKAECVGKEKTRAIASQGYQSIPEARFQEIFKGYLCQRLGKEKSDVIVSRLKVVGNRPVHAGKLSFQLFQKDKRRLAGNVRLVAIISVNGVVRNKVRLSGWVDIFDYVVCNSGNLKKGTIIKEDDVYLARENISQLSPNIFTDIVKVVGQMVKHNLKEDTCLKEWMLEKSPIVNRGDIVIILAESGDLKVSVSGKVLEKGYLGSLVKVQNSMSKKKIYAKVVNKSTVLVDF